MKFGVIADIHGNSRAFRTCVDYLEKENVDAYIFLGDYVGELPNPELTLSLIHELEEKKTCYVIRGNKEDYVLNDLGGFHPEWNSYPSLVGMLRYGFEHTNYMEREYFKSLNITEVISVDGFPDIRICHGTPDAANGAMSKASEEYLSSIKEDVVLFGHSHRPATIRVNGKAFYNPGSAGLPIGGKTAAQCMILEGIEGKWIPSFLELSYDVEGEIQAMEKEHLFEKAPWWSIVTKKTLLGCPVTHGTVLKYAMDMCLSETGECTWPMIPEKYMEKAVKELILDKYDL